MHEAFDIGDDSQVMKQGKGNGNLWPPSSDLPEFRPAVEKAFNEVMTLGKRLLPLFALALDLPENYFEEQTKNPGSTFRLLSYPPQFGEVDLKEIGIGAHQVSSLSLSPCRIRDAHGGLLPGLRTLHDPRSTRRRSSSPSSQRRRRLGHGAPETRNLCRQHRRPATKAHE